MNEEAILEPLILTERREHPPVQAFFEEDILVPDSKADAVRIVSASLGVKITDKEVSGKTLRISGDMYPEVLYETLDEDFAEDVISSAIPFVYDFSDIDLQGEIELQWKINQIDAAIINERKIRMKPALIFQIIEYRKNEVNVLKGFREQAAEVLESETEFDDIKERRKDYLEIKDSVSIKDGMPEIGRILKKDFRILETYRQTGSEKIILSGVIHYDILYAGDGEYEDVTALSGSTEFSQFIRTGGADYTGNSDIQMKLDDVRLIPKRDEEGNMTIFEITAGISSSVNTYEKRKLHYAEDVYSHDSIFEFECEELGFEIFCGAGKKEFKLNENIELPDFDDVKKAVFVSGEAIAAGGKTEEGKITVEGIIETEIICVNTAGREMRSFNTEIPFSCELEIPQIKPEMEIKADVALGKLEWEQTNDRRIEIKADIQVSVDCREKMKCKTINNVKVMDGAFDRDGNTARLILYVSTGKERLWDIGKCYRANVDGILKINRMDESVSPRYVPEQGERLIIWA